MINKKKLTVGYLRLSERDLKENKDYSKSIKNQSIMIHKYAKDLGFQIDTEYIDDGYSGIHFNRPSFERLIDDIHRGKIGTIITKDISRLGREFIETAYYISEYFPRHHVRYIAINDRYDSSNLDIVQTDMMLNIQTIINDKYVKDISKKRRQVAELKTKEGQFIGSYAPYGYQITNKNGQRKLEIDEYAASIIRRIFLSIANGKKQKDVAEELNKENILPPILYMNMTLNKNRKYFCDWTENIIYRILTNITYTGELIVRKSVKDNYKNQKRDYICISDREMIQNTHEAIISNELYEKVNLKLRRKKKSCFFYDGYFSKKVICGECGKIMNACRMFKNNKEIVYWKCNRICNRQKCSNRCIYDSKLQSIVFDKVKNLMEDFIDENDICDCLTNQLKVKYDLKRRIRKLRQNIDLCNENIHRLYMKKVMGEISQDEFLKRKGQELSMREHYDMELLDITSNSFIESKRKNIRNCYNDFLQQDILLREWSQYLINKIVIYHNNTIIVSFNFSMSESK